MPVAPLFALLGDSAWTSCCSFLRYSFGSCRVLVLISLIFRYPTSGYPTARRRRAPPWSELGLWVPLLAANLLVEPESLAAALCGTASGGCGSTPALVSVFRSISMSFVLGTVVPWQTFTCLSLRNTRYLESSRWAVKSVACRAARPFLPHPSSDKLLLANNTKCLNFVLSTSLVN